MTVKPDNAPARKKPYVKPEIQRVVLRPEEAVLGSCKTAQGSGPGGGRCNKPSPCSTIAS
jgi:hypothetical protein